MNKPKTKKEQTTIIMDVESIQFNPEHELWYTVDDHDRVSDFFTYSDFYEYVKNVIAKKLSNGYVAVAIESQHRIEITFAAQGKLTTKVVSQMADKNEEE